MLCFSLTGLHFLRVRGGDCCRRRVYHSARSVQQRLCHQGRHNGDVLSSLGLPEGLTDFEADDRDNWVEVDYTPRSAELAPLDELTEQDIKNSYYSLNREGFETGGQKYGPEVLELHFFGQFNGYYILRIRADIWGYSEAQYVADYDGIVFYELTSPALEVFYYYN